MRKPACCEVTFCKFAEKYYICENQFFMRKVFRNILKGISVTSALFVFQACYGGPMPEYPEYIENPEADALVQNPEETAEEDAADTIIVENAE